LAFQAQLVAQVGDIFPAETVTLQDPDEWDGGIPEQTINTAFLCVAPTDAEFPEEIQIGGGAMTCMEWGAVGVWIFSDSRLDQVGHMAAALYDENEGLLELKRRVLRALVGQDLTGGDGAQPLLAELVPAKQFDKPRKNPQGLWFIKLVFGALFMWDLS
jgi:hypothetical protein